MRSKWFATLVIIAYSVVSSGASLDHRTSPNESLYDINLYISDTSQCNIQDYRELCSAFAVLQYKECSLWSTSDCSRTARVRVSFNSTRSRDSIVTSLHSVQSYKGISIDSTEVFDVNECIEDINICSQNGYCINALGTYSCQCGFGYQQAKAPTYLTGTYCVARCNSRSCRNGGACSAAVNETSEVICQCPSGYTGPTCQDKTGAGSLPQWAVILIAVISGLSALIGVILCVYACYRLFSRRSLADDNSDTSSINGFKPRAIPGMDYDRMTDLGSISRSNRGFASTIDEESERGSIKSNTLKFGTRLMSSRLSIPSEHGDPTPPIEPFNRTDRHAASDIVSQPDYY